MCNSDAQNLRIVLIFYYETKMLAKQLCVLKYNAEHYIEWLTWPANHQTVKKFCHLIKYADGIHLADTVWKN